MRKLAATFFLCAAAVSAQTAETIFFRAILSPANEVPPITIQAGGAATIQAHVVRDASGQIVSGSVDFVGGFAFPSAVTVTGLHIHPGAAGTNGGVVISSGLSGTNTIVATDGRGQFNLQGQVRPNDQTGLEALRGLVANPSAYYCNLHTTDNPGGVMRGQLQKADVLVVMGMMSPNNEVPATGINASGVSHVVVLTTRDSSGALTSGQMIFDVNYNFPGQQTFTGFHIHNGPAGANAGVIFNTGIGGGPQSVQSDPSGIGNIRRVVEVDMTSPVQVSNLQGLLDNSQNYYINLHTTDFPGGAIRDQLRRTDKMVFQTNMLTSNETPPITGLNATAVADVDIRTVRAEDGTVLAGVVAFDVNFRFPDTATFTGLHIHDGVVGVAGPVTISSGLTAADSVASDTGFGNIFRTVTVSSAAGIATLNSLVRNPENHYVNLHTTVNPGGVVRAPLAAPNTASPVVNAVISANLDKNAKTTAPNGLIAIFGSNLAKVGTNLDGWLGKAIPDSLNGVAVAIGGQRARLLYVSPTQINAEVPLETPVGNQSLGVNNGSAVSAAFPVTVASAAPAVFFFPDSGAAIAQKFPEFSLVTADNPAHAGDTIIFYVTGMGQTTPAVSTGVLVDTSQVFNTVKVTASIGGQNADVISSVATPTTTGLYQVALKIPNGVAAGNATVVLKTDTATANTVTLPVR